MPRRVRGTAGMGLPSRGSASVVALLLLGIASQWDSPGDAPIGSTAAASSPPAATPRGVASPFEAEGSGAVLVNPFPADGTARAEWVEVPRVRAADIESPEAFQRDVLDAGRLLVIEGAASHWPALQEWSLQWFADRFPDYGIQLRSRPRNFTAPETATEAEVDGAGRVSAAGGSAANHSDGEGGDSLQALVDLHTDGKAQRLTLGTYAEWAAAQRSAEHTNDTAHPSSPPHYFSWVNNAEGTSRALLRPLMGSLPFLAASQQPGEDSGTFHPEWIYFGTRGGGVTRHIDSMCHAKYSVMLRGSKRWLLSPAWTGTDAGASALVDDVQYTAELHPGDVLVFYPSYWHETFTTSDESLSFNGYMSWLDTDNDFLRELVRASLRDDYLFSFYSSCFSASVDSPEIRERAVREQVRKTFALCEAMGKMAGSGTSQTSHCDSIKGLSEGQLASMIESTMDHDVAKSRAPRRGRGGRRGHGGSGGGSGSGSGSGSSTTTTTVQSEWHVTLDDGAVRSRVIDAEAPEG